MESLSKVSEYLDNLETILNKDEGSAIERMEILVGKEMKTKVMEEDDFVLYEPKRPLVITFTKAKPREYNEPNMSYSTPCGVEGIGAWDAECNIGQYNIHMTIALFEILGNRKFDVETYGSSVVTNAKIEIHGYKFGMDLVIDEYKGTMEPSIVYGRDFLITTKFTMNFGLGEMQINIGELQDDRDVDLLLE
ncbi:hypothetical protein Tco_1393632 [Tanacetum coccineum]